ncbi:MAG: hypothetical protein R3D45_15300 [Rhizobiaceae bacterium]
METILPKPCLLPAGYSTGPYDGRRYGTTLTVSEDGRRMTLYAEELGSNDHVSFNLYLPNGGKAILERFIFSRNRLNAGISCPGEARKAMRYEYREPSTIPPGRDKTKLKRLRFAM